MKTYSASSGFVYQYRFESRRADSAGDLFLFQTTQDRHSSFTVTILLSAPAVADWEARERRELSPTERYALAKMALFTAFDDAPHPTAIPQPVTLDAAQVSAIARLLDL